LVAYGYHGFLIYDNFGILMGRDTCADTRTFRDLLAYHQADGCYYLDLLIMDAASFDPFAETEETFFRENAKV
jgi:hypothetical protein